MIDDVLLKEKFHTAKPFPHLVLDNFLEKDYFSLLISSFKDYQIHEKEGKFFNSPAERKKWISLNTDLPKNILLILDTLNKKSWISNLKMLTGLDTLYSTKVGNTLLANYHEMMPGGVLVSHVDHSSDQETGLPHVLNIILFLSPEWRSEYGGSTLFWNQSGKEIVQKVEYIPNRAVIFLHTPYSFHSVEHIEPSHNYLRRTIYVDYYSESLNPYAKMDLDFPNKWFEHGTTFRLNKRIDYIKPRHFHYLKAMLKYKFNKLLY